MPSEGNKFPALSTGEATPFSCPHSLQGLGKGVFSGPLKVPTEFLNFLITYFFFLIGG